MKLAFVSFTEGTAIAALLICVSSLYFFRIVKPAELPQIFSYSAQQSAIWLFTAAVVMLWVRLLGEVNLLDSAWLKQLNLPNGWILLAISIPVSVACYYIGPIAAILLSTTIFLPLASAIGISPMQLGVILLINLALIKIVQSGSC
jgi:TRAP-type C4-dicarboxylate transport system permease large subunit